MADRDTTASQEPQARAGVASARHPTLPCACSCACCLWDLWEEGQGCTRQEAPGSRSSGGHQQVACYSHIHYVAFIMLIISLKALIQLIAIISLISNSGSQRQRLPSGNICRDDYIHYLSYCYYMVYFGMTYCVLVIGFSLSLCWISQFVPTL